EIRAREEILPHQHSETEIPSRVPTLQISTRGEAHMRQALPDGDQVIPPTTSWRDLKLYTPPDPSRQAVHVGIPKEPLARAHPESSFRPRRWPLRAASTRSLFRRETVRRPHPLGRSCDSRAETKSKLLPALQLLYRS